MVGVVEFGAAFDVLLQLNGDVSDAVLVHGYLTKTPQHWVQILFRYFRVDQDMAG